MLRLRPHHLLCLFFYEGKGYSEAFVNNMNAISQTFNEEVFTRILLVDGCDSICQCCPHHTKGSQCVSNQKVEFLDKKTIELFQLETEKVYPYQVLAEQIAKELDEGRFKEICGGCEWYKQGVCGKGIIKDFNFS